MSEANSHTRIVDYYADVVLPALTERLDVAFPEFGWRRDSRGWVATNEEMTHRVLGVRAERVVAHGPAPRGFLIHGAHAVLWTAYVSGGRIPHGAEFVRAVRDLAERAGVDTAPLERTEPRDRKAELLGRFFDLAQRELMSESGASARDYLESRGFSGDRTERAALGLVPAAERTRSELRRAGFTGEEIANSGLLADRRWPGRLCGAWRDERGQARTIWARAVDGARDPDSKFLYLRGAGRTGLPPYGYSDVLAQPSSERRDLVVVEGLLDVHHFRACGISNVVALGGTSAQPETFERFARHRFERVTICLDRDGPGRVATARVIEHAVRATRSPAIFVLEPEELAPSKDPDAYLRDHGTDAWLALLGRRECGVTWRARELLNGATPESSPAERREAVGRAGSWLGRLPARLALEQEDAIRSVAERSGYSPEAVNRAFQARYWTNGPDLERRQSAALETA